MPYYPPASSGSGYSTVEEEGTPVTQRTTLNFIGGNVTAADSGGKTTITVSSAAGSATETEIDFGSGAPLYEKKFTITDAGVSPTSKVFVVQSGSVATSRVGDDAEWDSVDYAAKSGTGEFTLLAVATPGPIKGKRKIFYTIY
jgi:hypothetical protein